MTNELLADSDANIASTLIEWIGDEARVTENNLIMGQIKTKKEVELNGLDDIKKVLNVTLGSAFKQSSRIITNDDGLQYLDTLRYIQQLMSRKNRTLQIIMRPVRQRFRL